MSGTQILDTLLAITQVLQADQERELDRRGLTTTRTHLLWILFHGGPATQVQLAEAIAVTPRNVTALVDALESTGFARREPHPTDRRAVLVHLTERGLSIMETMNAEHTALGADLIEGLDEETVRTAQRALDHVRARLEELIAAHEERLHDEEAAR
ncbi:MarR family transcriptional regulator [Microbacterium sp. CFBP9034]|uniref:MarR family winged helix-turn-helix transcriptional regulator n=1 Tax=Microbacterium sp. CFBP9034 TaxID=3096540 RepID=UPI002A6B88B1|nr:MarR family transcriptional regulator [Microbacterium sp. CFBP9034]MDY0909659.1 MarR family transcriptional regulator [Microbacterium sp. CFBP9034]